MKRLTVSFLLNLARASRPSFRSWSSSSGLGFGRFFGAFSGFSLGFFSFFGF